MKMKKPVILGVAIVAAACALVAYGLLGSTHPADSAATSPTEQASRLIPQLVDGSTTVSLMSSNPYDYAADNPKLDALVALGTPALAELDRSFAQAPDDGLDTYLMAIAAERIAKVDLRANGATSPWGTGKEWLGQWHSHLKTVAVRVKAIAKSKATADEKTASLVALGTPAIPFILDEVAAGDSTLSPAAMGLMRGSSEVAGVALPAAVSPAWARDNATRFQALRDLVAAAQ